ncbi:MAG: hypothetical protein A2270_11335 [Elusimicrobia bacterium RIFOXYA12_FULL_51_18]|nr:MAG: hypothetical protein A2270_11335 [Elusimicrobia bacterium RIFOXYA12_FULL_51_18]OGS30229.1 MAG: hypothetical protein A2218_12095 [Elusimicrobia bacterium RIFOXYA2_FULL_53_38]
MKNSGYRTTIGKKVRHERLRHGWSQEELAEKAEVHPSFIGQIERGLRSASFQTLERLSGVLGVQPADFLRDAPGIKVQNKPYPIEQKIINLLKGCSSCEQQVVYQTIKHLLRQRRKLSK